MKYKISVTFLFALIAINQVFADTIPDNSLIYGTWITANSPYVIMGKAEVPYDSTLIIEAGVTVKLLSSTDFADFDYNTLDVGLLKVYGKIIAEGNENDSIIFTRTGDGNWGSVSFLNYSEEPNAVKFCHVSYGHYIYTEAGIIFDGGITFNGANAIINNSLFEYNQIGITWSNSDIILENCTIRNNYNIGVSDNSSFSTIHNNWIYNNSTTGILSHLSSSIISDNTIENSLNGIVCIESYDTISNNNIRNNDYVGINLIRNNSVVRNNLIFGSNSGIRCDRKPKIINNTVINNYYFGIYCDMDASPIIVNSIIYGNQHLITYVQGDTIVFANCLIQEDSLPVGIINGGGNIFNQDPCFFDAQNEDFSLSINSPCIDAGTSFFVWENDTILDLSPDDYFGNAPDIGAIESEFVGVERNSQLFNYIDIMPNPASSMINVSSSAEMYQLMIRNLSGNTLIVKSISSMKESVDVSRLDDGLFFVSVLFDNGSVATKKLVIR